MEMFSEFLQNAGISTIVLLAAVVAIGLYYALRDPHRTSETK